MAEIALARSFIDALAHLEPAATKRAAAFLDRLVRDPEQRGLHSEAVRDARDRRIRSLRVTDDLRAIAHVSADRLLLLFVAHHDEAYLWARGHCIDCSAGKAEIAVVTDEASPWPEPAPAAAATPPRRVSAQPSLLAEQQDASYGWFCTVEDGHHLCSVLDAAGIEHGLAH